MSLNLFICSKSFRSMPEYNEPEFYLNVKFYLQSISLRSVFSLGAFFVAWNFCGLHPSIWALVTSRRLCVYVDSVCSHGVLAE